MTFDELRAKLRAGGFRPPHDDHCALKHDAVVVSFELGRVHIEDHFAATRGTFSELDRSFSADEAWVYLSRRFHL